MAKRTVSASRAGFLSTMNEKKTYKRKPAQHCPQEKITAQLKNMKKRPGFGDFIADQVKQIRLGGVCLLSWPLSESRGNNPIWCPC